MKFRSVQPKISQHLLSCPSPAQCFVLVVFKLPTFLEHRDLCGFQIVHSGGKLLLCISNRRGHLSDHALNTSKLLE